jgi:hypothetical protein
MFTEQSLRDHPSLVKVFMGIDAEQFWELIQSMTEQEHAYTQQRRLRPDRRRAGRRPLPRSLPDVANRYGLDLFALAYPQATVALLFVGPTQSDLSRDLCRLLPLIQLCLPCPLVWEEVPSDQDVPPTTILTADELTDGRVLVDATEQRICGPHDNSVQKAYYSGKKHAHTLKTQVVADGEHHLKAMSVAAPGASNDKALSDRVQTIARLPDGCEADAGKGYQGLAAQVPTVRVCDPLSGEVLTIPRLTVLTPFKKPKGHELTDEEVILDEETTKTNARNRFKAAAKRRGLSIEVMRTKDEKVLRFRLVSNTQLDMFGPAQQEQEDDEALEPIYNGRKRNTAEEVMA